jgi:hypothetical protein
MNRDKKTKSELLNNIIILGIFLLIGHTIKEEAKKQYPEVMLNAPNYIKIIDKLC